MTTKKSLHLISVDYSPNVIFVRVEKDRLENWVDLYALWNAHVIMPEDKTGFSIQAWCMDDDYAQEELEIFPTFHNGDLNEFGSGCQVDKIMSDFTIALEKTYYM